MDIWDCGSVNGADGARVAGAQRVTPARTGAGVYTLTLDDGGLDSAECVVMATVRAAFADNCAITVEHTSDTVKTVSTGTGAGTAADLSFDLSLIHI